MFCNENIEVARKEYAGLDFDKRFNEDFRENKEFIFSLGKNVISKEEELKNFEKLNINGKN